MPFKTRHLILPVISFLVLGFSGLRADVVETRDGSRIVGKITKIDGGSVFLETAWAGNLTIKQSDVVGIITDKPAGVRLATGQRTKGLVTTRNGAIQIAGPGVPTVTDVSKIAALWPQGGKDPRVAALERHWKFEASLDVNGESGNQNQLGTEAGLKATYANSIDSLQLYSDYNRQVTNSQESANQFKSGADYADNYQNAESWYAREEGGFDRVMGISFYDIAAIGLGHDLIKNKRETLTARVGVAYLYDGYYNPATPIVHSVGADFGIEHILQLGDWKLTNRLAVDPAFADFHNYSLEHESAFEIPMKAPGWKLKMGVHNEYNSEPGLGIQKLDTTYFTRLILDL
jgi:putative salt-induced outer membrane protein YdiY